MNQSGEKNDFHITLPLPFQPMTPCTPQCKGAELWKPGTSD